MIFDGGLFFIMLGLGITFMVSSLKFSASFLIIGAIIFIVLSMIMFAHYDVAFFNEVNDGTNIINQTSYVIGNGTSQNTNASWLAWIFLFIGIMAIIIFFVSMMQDGGTR